MAEGIFCGKCGTNNEIPKFRCTECRSLIRPVYPTVLAVATLCVIYFQWLLFMKSVVPAFTSILSSHGSKFSLPVRVAMAAGQAFTGWGVLFGFVFIALLLWLGLFWRPEKAFGRNFVMTVVLAKTVGVITIVLLAALDVMPFLSIH